MKEPAIYFVITIDTEADHRKDWTKSDPLSFKSITEAIPQRLEPLFKKYGAAGTYLLTAEVLEDRDALKVMKALSGSYELGTHLHPEYIAPHKTYSDYAGTYSTEFSNNLPADIEKEKIRSLTMLFEEKVGYMPRVYRGGKFGFGRNTAAALADIGYLIDTSVTPKVSWSDIGGPDFKHFPDQPYFVKSGEGNGHLLEVPVSIAYLNAMGVFLNSPQWLRPSFGDFRRLKMLIDNFRKRYSAKSAVALNMMFHSMEFFPGASPYSQDEDRCGELLKNLEDALAYCKAIGARFCRLSELYGIFADKDLRFQAGEKVVAI